MHTCHLHLHTQGRTLWLLSSLELLSLKAPLTIYSSQVINIRHVDYWFKNYQFSHCNIRPPAPLIIHSYTSQSEFVIFIIYCVFSYSAVASMSIQKMKWQTSLCLKSYFYSVKPLFEHVLLLKNISNLIASQDHSDFMQKHTLLVLIFWYSMDSSTGGVDGNNMVSLRDADQKQVDLMLCWIDFWAKMQHILQKQEGWYSCYL